MIRINLTPPEELATPYWWVPDAVVLVLLTLIASVGVTYYLSFTTEETAALVAETTDLTQKTQGMQGDVEKHKELVKSLTALENKQAALSRITESKITRYLPIILIEHIQNLKPEGVWLNRLAFSKDTASAAVPIAVVPTSPKIEPSPGASPGATVPSEEKAKPAPPIYTDSNSIVLEGYAFDNIIVAEFMTALKSTKNQDVDAKDIRTAVYFDNVSLDYSKLTTVDPPLPKDAPADTKKEKVDLVQFRLTLKFAERSAAAAPIAAGG